MTYPAANSRARLLTVQYPQAEHILYARLCAIDYRFAAISKAPKRGLRAPVSERRAVAVLTVTVTGLQDRSFA
jgi:hypothetical protein